MDLVDRSRRIWLLLHRAYRLLQERGIITRAELEQAEAVLNRLDELPPDEIRRRLTALGRTAGADAGPAEGGGEE